MTKFINFALTIYFADLCKIFLDLLGDHHMKLNQSTRNKTLTHPPDDPFF